MNPYYVEYCRAQEPARMQLAKLLKAHRATPVYCREHGVFEILTSLTGAVLGL